ETPLVEVSPTQRAQDRAWSYQASKHYLVQCSAQRSSDLATLEERSGKLRKAFAKAEREIGAGPYFRGAVLGNVDIAWLPLLHRASIIENRTGYDFLKGFPGVKSWQSALLESEILADSVSADFEDRFADFYLADDTYLGNLQATRRYEAQCSRGGACC
ncbi:MAG: glutathione S-transferase domain-containing protein, partial [Planctomycetota bacterium]